MVSTGSWPRFQGTRPRRGSWSTSSSGCTEQVALTLQGACSDCSVGSSSLRIFLSLIGTWHVPLNRTCPLVPTVDSLWSLHAYGQLLLQLSEILHQKQQIVCMDHGTLAPGYGTPCKAAWGTAWSPGSLQGSPSHSVEPGPKPTTLPASDVWCPCCTGSLALAQWNQDRSMETYVPTYRTKVRRFGGTRGGWLCGPPCHSQPCVLQPTGPCSTCSTAWCTCPEEGMDPSALRGPPSGSGNFQSHPDSSSSSKSTSSEAGVERWKAYRSTAGNSHHAPAKSQVVDWKVTLAQTPSDPSQCRHQSSTVEPLRSCLVQCWGFRARAAARGQSMALDTGGVWGGIVSGCSQFFLEPCTWSQYGKYRQL